MTNRDTCKYKLKGPNGETKYIGITDNLVRREKEHRDDGKVFTTMEKVGRKTTREAAENWEEKAIQTYKDSHHGHRPTYNKNDSGK